MKHLFYAFILVATLVSCGPDSKHFRIEGRLLNINQGEFYLYSPDGAIESIDTIKVQAGRFAKDITLSREATLMLVFPNFTEQPIFAQPGKSVSVEGDAYHLKVLTVKGTTDNKLMNAFRQQTANASPAEVQKQAQQFINEHPESAVSVWMVRRYFVTTPSPDYATARTLIATLLRAQPDNGSLRRLQRAVSGQPPLRVGAAVPRFNATAIDGTTISDATLCRTPYAVVCVWASWSYESITLLRQLLQLRTDSGGKLTVISISLDASAAVARNLLKQNSLECATVCDGRMADSRLYRQLGLYNIPDNILLHNGRVVGTNMQFTDITTQVRK